jgi:hypothetical protein
MSKLPSAYVSVLKYGKAPEEGIHTWLDVINKYHQENTTGNTYADGSHPDYAFADWLEENDDPRHLIVKRDIDIRNQPAFSWGLKSIQDLESKFGKGDLVDTVDITPETGELTGTKINTEKGTAYRIYWEPSDRHGNNHVSYHANLTKEELEHILDSLNIDKSHI